VDRRNGRLGNEARAEGAEVSGAVSNDLSDDAQPRERLDGELDPGSPLGVSGAAVVARLVLGDQSKLADLRLQSGIADHRCHAGRDPHHLGHPGALFRGREVGTDAAPDVPGGAHIEDAPLAVLEQVDARPCGQTLCEVTFAALGRTDPRGERAELFEGHDALAAHSREQPMQDVDGGAGILQRAMIGGCRGAEQLRQSPELAVGCLVLADQLSGQVGGVDDAKGRPHVTGQRGCGLEERDVKGRVVGDQDAVAGELQKGRKHALDPWRVGHHLVGDAGEDRDECGDRLGRVDQGLELADHLPASDLDRAHLGDVCP